MLKFVFPLSYKYSAKYRVIASLMAPPSFVLYVYTISFVGAFPLSIMITLSISARIGSVSHKSCGEQNTPKLYQEYPRALGPSALARFSIVP